MKNSLHLNFIPPSTKKRILFLIIISLLSVTLAAQSQKNFNELWHPYKGDLDKVYGSTANVVLYEHPEPHKTPPLSNQIELFKCNANKGEYEKITYIGDKMNDKTSAIYVPRGFEVIVYENPNFGGKKYLFTEGYYPFLDVSKDIISSMKIKRLMPEEYDENGPVNAAYFFRHLETDGWYPTAQGLNVNIQDGSFPNHHSIDCWDCFNYIYIRGDFEVLVYDDDNFEGRSNEEAPFMDKFDGNGTLYSPQETGFENKINGIKIIQTGWKLAEFNMILLSKTVNNNLEPLGAGVISKGNIDASVGLSVEKSYEKTWEHTFEHAFGTSLTLSKTAEMEAGPLIASVKTTVGIEVGASMDFSNSWSNGTSEGKVAGLDVSADIPANCNYECQILGRPMTVNYKTEAIYERINSIGEPIKLSNGKIPTKKVSGLFKVKDFTEFMAVWNSSNCGNNEPIIGNNENRIQVSPNNMALNKICRSSSNFHNTHFPGYAVDGEFRDRHSQDEFGKPIPYFHTNIDDNPWWEVDLGEVCDISKINLYNVTDEYKDRLEDLYIRVSEEPFKSNNDGSSWAGPVTPDLVGSYPGFKRGRFVRIYLTKKGVLNFCEVEVIGKPVDGFKDQTFEALDIDLTSGKLPNVAKGKSAKQSSIHLPNRGPEKAVDGISDDHTKQNDIAETKLEENPWWEVDLGQNHQIRLIEIYNLTDLYRGRLMNSIIKVSKTPFSSNDDGELFAENVYPDFRGQYFGNAVGRYVRLYVPRSTYLSMAELEVRGIPVDDDFEIPNPGSSNNNNSSTSLNTGNTESFEEVLLGNTFSLVNPTNDWDEGSFKRLDNGLIQWENKAGASWFMLPVYDKNYLDTSIGNCYFKDFPGGDKFEFIISQENLIGFKFLDEEYFIKK